MSYPSNIFLAIVMGHSSVTQHIGGGGKSSRKKALRRYGLMILKKKGKGMFLYTVVSSPLDGSKRFTLCLP